MSAWDLKKLNHFRHLVQFKLSECFFPLLEPVFRMIENRDMAVKKHFDLAMTYLEQRKNGMALLNLNLTLKLKPRHFLARVYRGRVFVLEGQTLLASEDYIKAHMINRYRFIHYGLYREYFKSMKKETLDLSASQAWDYNQVYEALRQTHDHISREAAKVNKGKITLDKGSANTIREEEISPLKIEVLSDKEQDKFESLGPITDEEVLATDWEALLKKLTS